MKTVKTEVIEILWNNPIWKIKIVSTNENAGKEKTDKFYVIRRMLDDSGEKNKFYQTPLDLYDARILCDLFSELKKVLEERTKIYRRE